MLLYTSCHERAALRPPGSGSGYLENRIVKMNSTNESECLKKRKNMIECSSNFETTSGQF